MKHLPIGPLYYEFNRAHAPRIRIASGETIVVESEDALSGQIKTNDDRRDRSKMPYSNPLTGPIAVEGAKPGDSLAVAILEIKPTTGQCATKTDYPRQLIEWLGNDCPHGSHVCPIRDGFVHWSDLITIPYAPMIGCIGTAPDWGCPTTGPAGPHGGNLDIVEVAPGSTLHLPVFVNDGLLYLGDLHAAMGHGELSATGLDMAGETTITVTLNKGTRLAWPRVESHDEIMVITSGPPMERSIAAAYAQLILWMEASYGWDRWRAYDILTHVGRISIGYYGLGTVAAKIEKRYLAGK